jgi:hypothetical protein
MESSPWAFALEIAEDYVIMAVLEEWYADALILNLAGPHGLVCYDPQTAKVHVPGPHRLKAEYEQTNPRVTFTSSGDSHAHAGASHCALR